MSEVDVAVGVKKPETEFMAIERSLISLTHFIASSGDSKKKTTEMEHLATGSSQLPDADDRALFQKPEAETSDGDHQSSKERRHCRQKRKYGRLKRIRLEGLSLPVSDATPDTESEKRFVVVDGSFRSPAWSSNGITPDGAGRSSWLNQKFLNRDRKWTPTRKSGSSKSGKTVTTTTKAKTRRRCERYLKQFVAALFSTVGLLCLMVVYTVLGGYVFSRLEASNEVTVKADVRQVTRHAASFMLQR